MKIRFAALIGLMALLLFSCQKEVSYDLPDGPGGTNTGNFSFKGTIQGNILDENGKPASGVKIQVGNLSIQTDARGLFHLNNAILSSSATMVTAEKVGYYKAFRVFNATSGANHVTLKLIKRNLSGRINASTGGAITLSNGTKVTLPSGGVMKASGSQPYTGDINVYASYIDPTATDIANTIPGSLLAKDKDGKEVLLKSFGMIAVELESTAGEKLQIASGKTASLTMPIPSSLSADAPASIPLWFVNEQTGVWSEEGSAVKNGSNYVGEVKHFTYWNCDISGPVVKLSATFQTSHGLPLVQAHVYVRSANGNGGAAHGITDSLGQVCGNVPANTPLVLEIKDRCNNIIFTQNIGSLTTATNLGVVILSTLANNAIVTLKGKLVNCANAPATNGYVIIYYDNSLRYIHTDQNGEFTTMFALCQSSPLNCEIIGIDNSTNQQSTNVNVTFGQPLTDVGTIITCGTSSTQFLNYTVDGVQYNIGSSVSDSLYCYPLNNSFELSGYSNQTSKSIYIRFANTGNIGPAPLQILINNNLATYLSSPVNVNMTNYPASVGQFYEGNFTAQFSYDSPATQTHTVSGSFRIRRIM